MALEKFISVERLDIYEKHLKRATGYTLRNIQNEIFAYRASCPPVPNGIQLIMKPKNEQIYVDYFETNLKEMHLQE